MCLKTYKLDPAHVSSPPGLPQQEVLKENKAKLDILTDPDMLLMLEKVIRDGICQTIN